MIKDKREVKKEDERKDFEEMERSHMGNVIQNYDKE